jgi:hypothetical protein
METLPESFSKSSIGFVKKLIKIQRGIPHNYLRTDQKLVNECVSKLDKLVTNNHYDDEQALGFWYVHREEIRIIFPTINHTAFPALYAEFKRLDQIEVQYSLTQMVI